MAEGLRTLGCREVEGIARLEGETRAAAKKLLADFELPPDDRPSTSLSVGNRQRLNLAIAMLGSPDVLLLDEPTAALDPRQRRRLWETAATAKEAGGAIVLVTQNVEDLHRVADRVAVLLDGEIVFDGSYAEYEKSEAGGVLA